VSALLDLLLRVARDLAGVIAEKVVARSFVFVLARRRGVADAFLDLAHVLALHATRVELEVAVPLRRRPARERRPLHVRIEGPGDLERAELPVLGRVARVLRERLDDALDGVSSALVVVDDEVPDLPDEDAARVLGRIRAQQVVRERMQHDDLLEARRERATVLHEEETQQVDRGADVGPLAADVVADLVVGPAEGHELLEVLLQELVATRRRAPASEELVVLRGRVPPDE
jgi:hypothetical protein